MVVYWGGDLWFVMGDLWWVMGEFQIVFSKSENLRDFKSILRVLPKAASLQNICSRS